MARPTFRRACCIRTSDTRSAKTGRINNQVATIQRPRSCRQCGRDEIGLMSMRKERPPRKAGPTEMGIGSAQCGWIPSGIIEERLYRMYSSGV